MRRLRPLYILCVTCLFVFNYLVLHLAVYDVILAPPLSQSESSIFCKHETIDHKTRAFIFHRQSRAFRWQERAHSAETDPAEGTEEATEQTAASAQKTQTLHAQEQEKLGLLFLPEVTPSRHLPGALVAGFLTQ